MTPFGVHGTGIAQPGLYNRARVALCAQRSVAAMASRLSGTRAPSTPCRLMESLGVAFTVFLVCALFVVLAGIGLARFGDELAEKTGWGTLWVGTILVSVATSLPELTINISAIAFQNSPALALGNVFGANMINIFVMASVGLVFGARAVWSSDTPDTRLLMLVAIGMVVLATVVASTGDLQLGPTSIGGIVLLLAYVIGMRAVYKAGRTKMHVEAIPVPSGSARAAWIGFGLCALVVIVAGRFLAASADAIATLSGISASFIGVLLVSIVTTLPEGAVTFAAAMRRSYGIVVGNVYGSCAFNVLLVSVGDLFWREGALLASMGAAHFAAALSALVLMTMGRLVTSGFRSPALAWGTWLAPLIPLLYIAALYWVYTLA
jgi:cation:H+ antiporter